jgi:DNA-binding NtrC family response regulator
MTYAEALKEFKANYWRDLLIQTNGNVTEAAKIAGVCRQQVWKITVTQLGMENPVRRKLRGNWLGLDWAAS